MVPNTTTKDSEAKLRIKKGSISGWYVDPLVEFSSYSKSKANESLSLLFEQLGCPRAWVAPVQSGRDTFCPTCPKTAIAEKKTLMITATYPADIFNPRNVDCSLPMSSAARFLNSDATRIQMGVSIRFSMRRPSCQTVRRTSVTQYHHQVS